MIFISIGGQQRPFKFGFNAIDIFCRERKIGINDFSERLAEISKGSATIGELRDIIYAGLAGGALSHNQQVDFTAYMVGDWLDELPQGELAKMMEAIAGAVSGNKKKLPKAPKQNKS